MQQMVAFFGNGLLFNTKKHYNFGDGISFECYLTDNICLIVISLQYALVILIEHHMFVSSV